MKFKHDPLGGALAALLASACSSPVEEVTAGPQATPAPAAAPPAEVTLASNGKGSEAPVLLPADPALRRNARVMLTGRGYTATAAADGATVQITGLPMAGAAAQPQVQRTEYGLDASFGRGGALYNVTLTCERLDDTRCADETFIRRLIDRLTPR